ncbi:CLUMA_CG017267, isoform A [Clunio marinus]|uniref:CLUMA_CG017267, isoform A n=1 Tax=Clunio marinus TaxID=568069 RepID=A0A1J1IX72_9DIPT|nr:CLUMA_CG017267, isoform A [Clunio marinus]
MTSAYAKKGQLNNHTIPSQKLNATRVGESRRLLIFMFANVCLAVVCVLHFLVGLQQTLFEYFGVEVEISSSLKKLEKTNTTAIKRLDVSGIGAAGKEKETQHSNSFTIKTIFIAGAIGRIKQTRKLTTQFCKLLSRCATYVQLD